MSQAPTSANLRGRHALTGKQTEEGGVFASSPTESDLSNRIGELAPAWGPQGLCPEVSKHSRRKTGRRTRPSDDLSRNDASRLVAKARTLSIRQKPWYMWSMLATFFSAG